MWQNSEDITLKFALQTLKMWVFLSLSRKNSPYPLFYQPFFENSFLISNIPKNKHKKNCTDIILYTVKVIQFNECCKSSDRVFYSAFSRQRREWRASHHLSLLKCQRHNGTKQQQKKNDAFNKEYHFRL